MRPLTVLALAVLLPGGAAAAMAEPFCGADTSVNDGERRIYPGDYLARCRPDGACVALSHVKGEGTPEGWGHRISFTRASRRADWIVRLASVKAAAKLTEGISLTVDENEDMQVPFEFLSTEGQGHEIALDARLSDVLIDEFRSGNRVTWSYVAKATGAAERTQFSLLGLSAAMTWIDCAQGKP